MREPLTPECLALYIESIADLSDDQVRLAIARAIRELEWFPKPAKIRELAGCGADTARDVVGESAWAWITNYLRSWGVDRLPVYSCGERIEAPSVPKGIEYALRAIGGLRALNQITSESRPFMKKDFITAYHQAPLAEQLAPQLPELSGERILRGHSKQLTAKPVRKEKGGSHTLRTIRAVPQPLTDAQMRERREILRQQTSALMNRSGLEFKQCQQDKI